MIATHYQNKTLYNRVVLFVTFSADLLNVTNHNYMIFQAFRYNFIHFKEG